MDKEAALLEAWKTTIDVVKHFNEIEMRVRSIAVTVLAAFLAASGFTVKERIHIWILGSEISLTALVLAAGLICWLAFYLIDRFWYHRLLAGAVQQAIAFENAISAFVPGMDLTQRVGRSSPVKIFKWKIHSNTKIDIFYGSVALLLFIAAIVSLFQPRAGDSAADGPDRNRVEEIRA